MKAHSIRTIHPEYLRPLPDSSESLGGVNKKRNERIWMSVALASGLFLIWSSMSLRAEVAELSSLITQHKGETAKVFKEYDALHQAMVEKLKRHSELLKGNESFEPEGAAPSSTHGVVTVPKANVRGTPATNSDVLMTVPAGSRLLIEGTVGEWFKVMTPLGTSGYLSRDVFKEAP